MAKPVLIRPLLRECRPTVLALFWLSLLAAESSATAQRLGSVRFDNWLSFQRNVTNSGQWVYQPRFYIPFDLSRGWTFTQRILMLIRRLTKAVEFGVGGAYALVDDDPLYRSIVYGRLTFYF